MVGKNRCEVIYWKNIFHLNRRNCLECKNLLFRDASKFSKLTCEEYLVGVLGVRGALTEPSIHHRNRRCNGD